MPPTDSAVQPALSCRRVGQLLDGIEVLIARWDATAAWFSTDEVGDVPIRECSDVEEAESIAGYYWETPGEIRRQVRTPE